MRAAETLEKLRFRGEIILHRLMVVEMVLCEIREHRRVELAARYAVLRQRVGRDLHHDVLDAFFDHARQQPLEIDDIRRRVLTRQPFLFDHRLDRADQADFMARMPQNRAQ